MHIFQAMNITMHGIVSFGSLLTAWGIMTLILASLFYSIEKSMFISLIVCCVMYTFPVYFCFASLGLMFALLFHRGFDFTEAIRRTRRASSYEVEMDGDGVRYAYKVVYVYDGKIFSPNKMTEWEQGTEEHSARLASDRIPTLRNENGIYCVKSLDHPTLSEYEGIEMTRIVRIAISGRCVETEDGYRAHEAEIVEEIGAP